MRLRRQDHPANRPDILGARHDSRRDSQGAVWPLDEKLIELSANTQNDVPPGRAEAGGDDASDCADPNDGDATHARCRPMMPRAI
jgi:hypothetical protein